MTPIYLAVLLFLSFVGIYVGFKFRTPAVLIITAVCLFLAGSALWTGGVTPAPSDLCLQSTNESSLYWNCTTEGGTTGGYCYGDPEPASCAPYTADQCRDIDGCTWDVDNCTGTPTWTCAQLGDYDPTGYKCEETVGCAWENPVTDYVNATCDSVNVTYRYDYCHAAGLVTPEPQPYWAGIFIMLGLATLGASYAVMLHGKGESEVNND